MLTLSSTGEIVAALRRAKSISMVAYILRPGAIEDALKAAAERGAEVSVRLEGQPYHDKRGGVLAINERAVDALRRAGVDATLMHTVASEAPLHSKAIVAGSVGFFDDCNFSNGADTILRDDSKRHLAALQAAVAGKSDRDTRFFASHKLNALQSEARLIARAQSDDVVVESESFGRSNPVYTALDRLAKSGHKPRLLVNAREAGSAYARSVLAHLAADGVQIRKCGAYEKFALDGARGWIGSANATADFQRPDQLDWSERTSNATIVSHLRERFEQRWASASRVA